MIKFATHFLDLVFPNLCSGCGNSLYQNEEAICSKCLYKLPKTNFHTDSENIVSQMFWGRIKTENISSFCYFSKGSTMQKIIHNLKYKNKKNVGIALGRRFGMELKNTAFNNIDVIIPVPLHFKKQRKRGYNQSEIIANGLAEILKKPVDTSILIRPFEKETQTTKSRYDRWENVEKIFSIQNTHKIINKHILLVDDVITTGATVEVCAAKILEVEGTRVSIVSLAFAIK